MKILKEKSREYKGKDYHKYKVNIPKEVLDSAGFQEGQELEVNAEKGRIVLRKGK